MKDDDRRAFYETWAASWESYGKTVTDRMLRFVFESLRRFDLEDIQRAIIRHSQDPDQGQYAPKPADIVRQIEGGGDERSLRAWSKLETAATSIGSWRPIAFDDARIHAIIEDMGGWMKFCRADNDEWPFLRNEFCKRYRAYLQRQPRNYPALITGEGGFDQEPALIGDQSIAQRVMLSGGNSNTRVSIGFGAMQSLTHQPDEGAA